MPPEVLRQIHSLVELTLGSHALHTEQFKSCAYLGPAGSFTHSAAASRFGQKVNYTPCSDVRNVFDLVANGRARYGVVALSNSISGHQRENIALLIEFSSQSVRAQGEIVIPIEHFLMYRGDLKEIREICSHPQALHQCEKNLNRLRTDLSLVVDVNPAPSTAAAARAASLDPTKAALGNALCADIWNLRVWPQHLEDDPSNRTRFLIIGREVPAKTGRDKTSIWFSVADRPGALASALRALSHCGLNIQMIEMLPIRNRPSTYGMYVELDCHASDDTVIEGLHEMSSACETGPIVIGAYPKHDGT